MAEISLVRFKTVLRAAAKKNLKITKKIKINQIKEEKQKIDKMNNKKNMKSNKSKQTNKQRNKLELKIVDLSATTQFITATGNVLHLNQIAQGTNYNNRVGNDCKGTTLDVNISLQRSPIANVTFVRFIYFYDLQQVTSTTPAVGDVLSTNSVTSTYNWFNRSRWKILEDSTYKMYNAHDAYTIIRRMKLQDLVMRFNSTTTSSIVKNGLYVLFISDQSINWAFMDYQYRLEFSDE